jgi:hypothetical protein
MDFKDFKLLLIAMLFGLFVIAGFGVILIFGTIVMDIAHIAIKRIDLFFHIT